MTDCIWNNPGECTHNQLHNYNNSDQMYSTQIMMLPSVRIITHQNVIELSGRKEMHFLCCLNLDD